jgi:hypothetical protein
MWGNFLDDLWDKAEGVFDRVVDFKLEELEIKRSRDQAYWEFNLQNDARRNNQYIPVTMDGGSGSGGMSGMMILGAVVVIGAVGYLALKD